MFPSLCECGGCWLGLVGDGVVVDDGVVEEPVVVWVAAECGEWCEFGVLLVGLVDEVGADDPGVFEVVCLEVDDAFDGVWGDVECLCELLGGESEASHVVFEFFDGGGSLCGGE